MEEPKIKIFLATPMYGGNCTGVFVQSLLDMSGVLSSKNIRLSCAFMFNESLITRARRGTQRWPGIIVLLIPPGY